MKKIFSILAIAAVLLVAGCKPKPVSILNQAKADYAEAIVEVPDSLTAFYEVQMVLDRPISVLSEDENVALFTSKTVYQQLDVVTSIDRVYDKKGRIVEENIDKVTGDWVGDFTMPLDSLVLDLVDAIEKLKEADILLPEADKVTLRCPAVPPFRTYYIFGTYGTFFLGVDAITGEISEFTLDEFVGIKKEEAAE